MNRASNSSSSTRPSVSCKSHSRFGSPIIHRYAQLGLASLVILVTAIGSTVSAAEASVPNGLEPVYFQHIKIGGFWKQQIKLQTEKWLPHCIKELEQGGEGQQLLNLIETGKAIRGQPHGAAPKQPWSDAYIYNIVESICLASEVDASGDKELTAAQAFLRRKLETWIPIILAAQEKDGYIDSVYTLSGKPRFTAINDHEFYVMGYFIEMGIAHYRMTGGKDRRLYDAALKCANMLNDTFGPAPKRTWKNGHPGLEHALCRLGGLVNEIEGAGKGDKYIALARYFLDHQHEIQPDARNQSDMPAVKMTEAKGHVVRANYFYTGMADIALLKGDNAYRAAADRLWESIVDRKMYLTGGAGLPRTGEAYGPDFVLPNASYCESCAGCGLSFWAEQMHRIHTDARYCDVQERVLYNNVLGGVALSGDKFYYQNPLTSDIARYSWHRCPCCVGNIPRALIAIKDLMYSTDSAHTELYLNHFVDSDGTIPNVGGAPLRIRQQTQYPWQGTVAVQLDPARPVEFVLKLRIPNRAESALYTAQPNPAGRFTLKVNSEALTPPIKQGYVAIRRTWREGDRVELELPMDIQRIQCDQRVEANRGRVALQRGPIVYSFEDIDNPQPAASLVLKPDQTLTAEWKKDLLGGVMAIEDKGIMAVPNYARLNRGGASQVWLVEDPAETAQLAPHPGAH